MKGKKFDACEKHFKEKELKLIINLNHLREINSKLITLNDQLEYENEVLKKENLELKTKYEKTLEFTKMNDMEIKNAIKMDSITIELHKSVTSRMHLGGSY